MRTYVMWYNKRLSLLYHDFMILKNGHHYDAILKIDNTSVDDLLPQDAREHEIRIGKLTERNKIKRASMDKRPLNGHGKQLLDLVTVRQLVWWSLMVDLEMTAAWASLQGFRVQVQALLIMHSVLLLDLRE